MVTCRFIVLNWESLVKEDWIEPLNQDTDPLEQKTVLRAVYQYTQKSCGPGRPETRQDETLSDLCVSTATR